MEETIECAPWMVTDVAACGDLIENSKKDIPESTCRVATFLNSSWILLEFCQNLLEKNDGKSS